RRRRQDGRLRRQDRTARARQGGRPRAHRLEEHRLSLPRCRDAAARRRDSAGEERGGEARDVRWRSHLSRRQIHSGRSRRRAQGAARRPAEGLVRRRSRASQAVQGAAAARKGVLPQLLRSREARAVLSAEFAGVGYVLDTARRGFDMTAMGRISRRSALKGAGAGVLAMVAAPAIVRAQAKEIVIGGAASHKPWVEGIVQPFFEKKYDCKIVYE